MITLFHRVIFFTIVCFIVKCSCSDPILIETIIGDQYDSCTIYPMCQEFGPGTHHNLEDCRRFIKCDLMEGNIYNQTNWMCPEGEAFLHTSNGCIDSGLVTDCNTFQKLKCSSKCPRIHFSSKGLAEEIYPDALGCFRYVYFYKSRIFLI